VRLLILILAVAMALEQIAVAQTVVQTAFSIAFGAVMTGWPLRLGLAVRASPAASSSNSFRSDRQPTLIGCPIYESARSVRLA
jgi:hypothetical protein